MRHLKTLLQHGLRLLHGTTHSTIVHLPAVESVVSTRGVSKSQQPLRSRLGMATVAKYISK